MGCSASTLDQHLSISGSALVMTAADIAQSDPDCCRTPPPTIANSVRSRSLLFVDSSDDWRESENDAWNLIDFSGEEEVEDVYQLVLRIESSMQKLMETYEIVEPGEIFDMVSSMSPEPILVDDVSRDSGKFMQYDVDLGLKKGRGDDDRVVLYFTSMRGIRKTYDDCREVKMILDGFRVVFDERDVAMDVEYRREVQSLMGLEGKGVALPQLFIGSKNVGGLDEVMRLHETGELRKLLEGYPVRHSTLGCCLCGDARFMVCPHCSGSTKVFDRECEVPRKCSHCSENGLVKCFMCNT